MMHKKYKLNPNRGPRRGPFVEGGKEGRKLMKAGRQAGRSLMKTGRKVVNGGTKVMKEGVEGRKGGELKVGRGSDIVGQ
jgi:hypothetical protein